MGRRQQMDHATAVNDFDEESKTPERATPRPVTDQPSHPALTDSQRDWFAQRLASGFPVVQTRDTPAPHELLARTTTPDELELLRHLRLAGDKTALAEFAVKTFAELRQLRHDFNRQVESASSDNEAALKELRDLLSRPPNGRTRALEARVDKLEKVDAQAERRLKDIEDDTSFAKRAAQGVIVFLILSIGAAGIWLGIREEKLSNLSDTVKDHDRKLERLRWSQPKDNTP